MLENCNGINFFNHLQQNKKNKLEVKYIQLKEKYNSNFDIPDFWINNEEKYKTQLKIFKNKELIRLIKENKKEYNVERENRINELKSKNKQNLSIIKVDNEDFMKWKCIVNINDKLTYECIHNTQKGGLINIMNDCKDEILATI